MIKRKVTYDPDYVWPHDKTKGSWDVLQWNGKWNIPIAQCHTKQGAIERANENKLGQDMTVEVCDERA